MTTKRAFLILAVGLLCSALLAGPVLAAEKQGEVAERIELNTATVEQLSALGVVTGDEAKRIVKLREDMGDFQSYDDLKEAGLPPEKIDKLKPKTTLNHMATDCSC